MTDFMIRLLFAKQLVERDEHRARTVHRKKRGDQISTEGLLFLASLLVAFFFACCGPKTGPASWPFFLCAAKKWSKMVYSKRSLKSSHHSPIRIGLIDGGKLNSLIHQCGKAFHRP